MRSATKKRTGKDPRYLEFVRRQPCTIKGIGFPCDGPVEAHHAGVRGMSQKAHDHTAIPLCRNHHRTGRDSAHVLGKRFWDWHELELQEVISGLHERYDAERPA